MGDPSTGKGQLILRYLSGLFVEEQKLSIGVEFYAKSIYFQEKKVKLQLWNPSGEERWQFLLPQYCKGSNGALILYNITDSKTLESIPNWVQLIRKHAGDIPIMLVGNRLNFEESPKVSKEEGIKLAKKHDMLGFCEVSSKTGKNIVELFDALTELMIEYYETSKIANKLKNEIL